ncbi:MAG TPA: FtsX-like permease family protein [Steroidobacteraceae bacterium]|nr:FtsX-like permease family protein [Steroidobacteraceae bacterium]
MFRNCLAAALRHLARNKLYTAISVFGLSIGLCTALLAALVVHNELSHDHFIPGYDRIYMVVTAITPPRQATIYKGSTNSFVGPQLARNFSEIQSMTRLMVGYAHLSHGNVDAHELSYLADPNAFQVLPLPVIAGDLKSALFRPNTVVLTRTMARKYFGRDAPIGESLLMKFDGHPETAALTVTAVIEDLPPHGTHLESGIFISAVAHWTELYRQDHILGNEAGKSDVGIGTATYLKLVPHASPQRLLQAAPEMASILWRRPPEGWTLALKLVRMDRFDATPYLTPGFATRLSMITIVGFGILLVACVNFVNLLTARSARRAQEVSLRKLAGAQRRSLVLQFLAESIAYVAAAAVVAVAITELLLPRVNAFLTTGATFRYWHDPALLGAVVLAALLLGTLAGAYPAFVLSGFRPLRVLTGENLHSRGAGTMRQLLVTGQFSILIGLIVAAAVVYQQRQFATQEALRVDTDQMLLIRSPCGAGFTSALRALQGVRGVACSSSNLVNHDGINVWLLKDRLGVPQLMYRIVVQPSLFDLYAIKPTAGRTSGSADGIYYVLNETGARHLGFARAAAAVGYEAPEYKADYDSTPRRNESVIGVVPDFSFDSVEHRIEAQEFVVRSEDAGFDLINVKLTGRQIPETLGAIDRLWEATGMTTPISRFFLDEHIQTLYIAMLREAQLFGVFAIVAVMLACLGLLGLAASISERRTREIGIRKALGANTGDILRLLLRQFARPVLWANLIAWPATAYAMHRWLEGFAYHVDLSLWLFPLAATLALVIALLAVTTQSILVARARPVDALRYE